jgi:hypothetical protein
MISRTAFLPPPPQDLVVWRPISPLSRPKSLDELAASGELDKFPANIFIYSQKANYRLLKQHPAVYDPTLPSIDILAVSLPDDEEECEEEDERRRGGRARSRESARVHGECQRRPTRGAHYG